MADESPIRTAMSRADTQGPAPKTEPAQNGATEIRRVHVKHEIAGYIDQVFQARTRDDGTILHTSREILVEDLTNIVEALLRKAVGARQAPLTPTYSIPPGAPQS